MFAKQSSCACQPFGLTTVACLPPLFLDVSKLSTRCCPGKQFLLPGLQGTQLARTCLPPATAQGFYGLRVTSKDQAGTELLCLSVDFELVFPQQGWLSTHAGSGSSSSSSGAGQQAVQRIAAPA